MISLNKLVQTIVGTATPTIQWLCGMLFQGVSGYATGVGAGGAVTQITNKATAVTLNTACGQITTNNAALNATTSVAFTLNNSLIGANDRISVWLVSGNTAKSYVVNIDAVAAGSCSIALRNYTAGNLSEAVVIGFMVSKGSIS